MTAWDVFPFEQAGLRVVPLAPPVLPEPARGRRGRAGLPGVRLRPSTHFLVRRALAAFPPRRSQSTGAPLILMLESVAHFDLPALPDELAARDGAADHPDSAGPIEALPHVARAHVSRWGDGGAHLHIFFFARPAGFAQLRGTCLAIWDDLLPAVPAASRDADAAAVARALADSHGGQAHPVP